MAYARKIGILLDFFTLLLQFSIFILKTFQWVCFGSEDYNYYSAWGMKTMFT